VDVELTYVTSRGRWYQTSWKGDLAKSGGVATNVGIHFFDMLLWLFGAARDSRVHIASPETSAGYLELAGARVRWFLSIDARTLPEEARRKGQRTYRSIRLDGREIEFSEGFTDLHTATYRDILGGGGYGLSEARPAIQLAHEIRAARASLEPECAHPFAREHATR
jgi:UDP-N-acetyl-2-amino-2-deoxyglucuronate dehydrogenase